MGGLPVRVLRYRHLLHQACTGSSAELPSGEGAALPWMLFRTQAPEASPSVACPGGMQSSAAHSITGHSCMSYCDAAGLGEGSLQ